MSTLSRTLLVTRQALGTLGRHAGAVLLLVFIVAAVRAPLDHLLYVAIVGPGNSLAGDQSRMVQYILADAGTLLAFEIVLGPILAAVVIYFARRDQAGKDSSLSAALRFAASRYRRMFFPHLAAQISIQVGIQLLLVPGLLFYGMYAFVEPVACLEDGNWPLDRSKALTRGRRATIMWLVIPVILVMFVKTYAVDLQALEMGVVALMAADMVNLLMELFLYTAFAWLYLERVTPKDAAPAPADSSTAA